MIPVLNDAPALARLLPALESLREQGDEIIVVDGGSTDALADVAAGTTVVRAARGRAAQMNAGAAVARGDILWFVHADTCPPDTARAALCAAVDAGACWGRYDVALDDPAWAFRMIETAMNWRSRLSGIATGDQAIFVTRQQFAAISGFAGIALMEDIEFSRRLRRVQWPACLSTRVRTSARRWRKQGIARTVALMWLLRLAYFVGVSPARLAAVYGYR